MEQVEVYLDTNVYKGAKYIFEKGKLYTLKKLVEKGHVKIIYTSATVGEVKEHIKIDLDDGIKKYNHVISKNLGTLVDNSKYSDIISTLNCEEVINDINSQFDMYLSDTGAIQISLNPLDAENLMEDYFSKRLPFEKTKPYEFKDAIMINAIKQYQKKYRKQICLVSSDEGFLKTFEGDNNFILFKYLGHFLKYLNNKIEFNVRIEESIIKDIESKRIQALIFDYLNDLTLYRFDILDWEYNDLKIKNIEECELNYIDKNNNIISANLSINSIIELETTFLDAESSYFDKEEGRYIITNYVNSMEEHKIYLEIVVNYNICESGSDIDGKSMYIDKDNSDSSVELSEDTEENIEIIEEFMDDEIESNCCSQCGRILRSDEYNTYYDYYGQKLCFDCAVTDDKGEICSQCGRKVPLKYMMSDICKECFYAQE